MVRRVRHVNMALRYRILSPERHMERPIFKPVGTPVAELDTPALVVDIDRLSANIEVVHGFFSKRQAKVRPFVGSHLSTAVARRQLGVKGHAGGLTVSTVAQAEVFVVEGFTDIFVANQIVTTGKMARLCALARQAAISIAVDNPRNVEALSEAATGAGVTIAAVVDVDTGLHRCGVEPGKAAVELAATVARSNGLKFGGIATYEGAILSDEPAVVETESKKALQRLLDTRQAIEAAGIEVPMVCAGGTHNYDIAGTMDGITDVAAGSYALMDAKYRDQRPELSSAAKIVSTVTSVPEPGLVVLDAGNKATGADAGLPVPDDLDGDLFSLSAEHGRITMNAGATPAPDLGDKVLLTPYSIGDTANVYDFMHVVRDGRLEAVWPVNARGLYW